MTNSWYTPEPGERVLWQGKPGRIPLFYRVAWAYIPLLATVGALLVSILLCLLSDPQTRLAAVIPAALLLIPLHDGIFQYVRLHRQLKRTEYVITDRRILRLWKGQPETLRFGHLPPVYMTLNEDGSGTIVLSADYLGHEHCRDTNLRRIVSLPRQFRLDCIPEVSCVWNLIHDTEGLHAA